MKFCMIRWIDILPRCLVILSVPSLIDRSSSVRIQKRNEQNIEKYGRFKLKKSIDMYTIVCNVGDPILKH